MLSYLAPPDQSALAAEVAQRCVRSFRQNPQWASRQQQMDAEALDYQRQGQAGRVRQLQRQVAEFEQGMKAMQQQVASFERRQQRSAAQSEKRGNILSAITPVVDPLGNRREVWTGTKSQYFQNGSGVVINSDVVPPGGDGRKWGSDRRSMTEERFELADLSAFCHLELNATLVLRLPWRQPSS